MTRWIVSLFALMAVASAFAGPSNSSFCDFKDTNNGWDKGTNSCNTTGGSTYCPTPPKDCNPKPPTNCVPEPTSMAAMAIGGVAFLRKKKKKA